VKLSIQAGDKIALIQSPFSFFRMTQGFFKKILSIFFLFFLFFLSLEQPAYASENPSLVKGVDEQVVILGGGVGGLTAGLYLARSGAQPLILDGSESVPGALIQSPSIQNWPGEPDISGMELLDKIRKQALSQGARLKQEEVVEVDFIHRPFKIKTRSSDGQFHHIHAQACIIAVGATPRFLHIPGENSFWTRGVHNCATCDGTLFKDKTVAIVGGGDGAIVEAEHLSKIAKQVYILVRSNHFRGIDTVRRESLLARSNVAVFYHTTVEEILGNEVGITSLVIQQENEKKTLQVDGVFLAIGSEPNTHLFKDQIQLDKEGYIQLFNGQQTSQNGVFAVGDVVDKRYRQAISAAGCAAVAAMETERYLSTLPKNILTSHKPVGENQIVSLSTVMDLSTSSQLLKAIERSRSTLVVDFYSTTCPPCLRFSPTFQKWAKQFKNLQFVQVNVEKSPELTKQYEITALPTLLILDKEGKVVKKWVGLREVSKANPFLKEINQKK